VAFSIKFSGIDQASMWTPTVCSAQAPRLYQLIRQRQPVAGRTLEIEFLDPGVRACVFTFG
jgi:hypothetical protein